jgi:hypothetical protein
MRGRRIPLSILDLMKKTLGLKKKFAGVEFYRTGMIPILRHFVCAGSMRLTLKNHDKLIAGCF